MKTSPQGDRIPAPLIFIVVIQSILVGLFHWYFHEPWRDEVQHVLLARDTAGFLSLLQALRYEGHPFLLHLYMKGLLLFLDARATLAVVAATGYFFLTAATSALIAGTRASRRETLLFSLLISWSYAAVYEMGVIARGYGLGMGLALFGLYWFLRAEKEGGSRARNAGTFCFALAILTSLHSALLALFCSLPFFLGWLKQRRFTSFFKVALPFSLSLLSLAFFLIDFPDRVVPPHPDLHQGSYVNAALFSLNDFFYHYGFPTHWWNIAYSVYPKRISALAIWLILFLTAGFVVRKRREKGVVAFAGSALLGVLVFEHFFRFVYPSSFRHHLFLVHPLFLALCLAWLNEPKLPLRRNVSLAALASVLVFQTFASGLALSSDYLWYFSQTAMIRDLVPDTDHTILLTDKDDAASSLSLWLPKAHFFSRFGGGRPFTYVRWDRSRLASEISREKLVEQFCLEGRKRPESSLFYVTQEPIFPGDLGLREIYRPDAKHPTSVQSEKLAVFAVDCLGLTTQPQHQARTAVPFR